MNYATIKTHDTANGPGVRVSLFVSGCTHQCKGCFNPEAWDFNYGAPFTETEEDTIVRGLEPWFIRGLSLLGGEPFDWPVTEELLSYIDVLVDGEFKLDLKNPNLRFRGSSNQRVIDLKKSLYGDELVLWSEAY